MGFPLATGSKWRLADPSLSERYCAYAMCSRFRWNSSFAASIEVFTGIDSKNGSTRSKRGEAADDRDCLYDLPFEMIPLASSMGWKDR